MLLLNPGPVTLTERVRRSLLQPDLCHRESEFFDLQDEARSRLLDVYRLDPAEWAAVLITGSGTAAVESMITSLVPEEGKLLVVENGVYGERITQIASLYRIAHETIKHDWMDALDVGRIVARLDADRAVTHVAVIHHETTTGRLNDLRTLCAVCRERGLCLPTDLCGRVNAAALRQRLLALRQQFEHGKRVLQAIVLLHIHEYDLGPAILGDHDRLTAVGHFANKLLRSVLQIRDRTDVRSLHRSEYSTEFRPRSAT